MILGHTENIYEVRKEQKNYEYCVVLWTISWKRCCKHQLVHSFFRNVTSVSKPNVCCRLGGSSKYEALLVFYPLLYSSMPEVNKS